MASTSLFLNDLRETLRSSRVWLFLGLLDIRLRYQRTVLGPFWLILSFAVVALAMGFIFSNLFNIKLTEYLPYLIAGLAAWGFLQTLVSESTNVFVSASSTILEHRLPLGLHVLRMLTRNTLVFAHSVVVVVCVALAFGVRYGWELALAIPALVAFVINGWWFGLLIGMLCTRFRDATQVATLVLQLVFFVTPVFWQRQMLGSRVFIVDFNPIYHFIEILRAPLLGLVPAAESWLFVGAVTLGGWSLTALTASYGLRRLAYWL